MAPSPSLYPGGTTVRPDHPPEPSPVMLPLRPLLVLSVPALLLGVPVDSTPSPRLPAPVHVTAVGMAIDSTLLAGYKWRNIGPDRGGRSIAVSGVRGRPKEAYFGAVGGGLWKTVDGGENWHPVTDGDITSASVGAVAVSESNPDVVFIGTGETCIRGNIMPGDGVYRSRDGGKTWTHVGFKDSDGISKIRIHPTNPDIIYVASFGKYSVPSAERGVFKSSDGGKTWKRVLFRDDKTGAIDISIDRNNPNVIYASLWEAYRKEYQMSSGGPGSGLFKSTDGGETWTEITRNKGMPLGNGRAHRRLGVARQLQPRLRPRGERQRRTLPQRRCRRHLGAGQRQARHPAARLLLHARLRRSQGRRRRLHGEHLDLPLEGRRQDDGGGQQRDAR